MDKSLAVTVDNSRQVSFLKMDGRERGRIPLTTLADSQTKAKISLSLRRGTRYKGLKSYTVTGIKPAPAGEPRIDMEIQRQGRRSFTVRIRLEGRVVIRDELTVPLILWNPALFPLVAGLVLIAAAGGWLFFSRSDSPPADITGREASSLAIDDSPSDKGREDAAAEEPLMQESSSTAGSGNNSPGPEETASGEAALEETSLEATAPGDGLDSSPPSGGSTVQEEAGGTAADEEPAPPEPSWALWEGTFTVYFQPEQSRITAEARSALLGWLQEIPDGREFILELQGHCALYGTEEGRRELSERRAEVVLAFLRDRRPDIEARVVEGLGAVRPVTRDRGKQHLNRRVEIFIRGEFAE